MTESQHRDGARGRWHDLSLAEQFGNIGSEVSRAIRWSTSNPETAQAALYRGLELFDWMLVTRDWGPEPVGRLILDDAGRMSLHLVHSDRSIGFFGSYAVDGDLGAVTFHIEGDAPPSYIGTDQPRFVQLEGDRLTLRSGPDRAGAADVAYEVVWERER